MGKAFARAFTLWRRHFGGWMQLTLISLCAAGMAFAPLLFLFSQSLKPLALLCLPLFALIALPLHRALARVQQHALAAGEVQPLLLFGGSYARDVKCGCGVALILLLCAAPALAVAAWLLVQYKGGNDGFTFLRQFQLLGSDTVGGLVRFVPLYLLLLVPLVIGMAFCAGNRHIHALDNKALLRRRHTKTALCWLLSQVTLLPFVLGAAGVAAWLLSRPIDLLGADKLLALPIIPQLCAGIGVAAAVLLLPLVSLRALIVAAWVKGAAEDEA